MANDVRSGATKRKVLVCDDEHVIADTLVIILRKHGYEAVAAYDGSDAVRQAQSFRPDFVITDVLMPQMNGIEATIAIQKLLPLSKIILFSGHAATSDLVEESRKHGMVFEVLAKPLEPADRLPSWPTAVSSSNPRPVLGARPDSPAQSAKWGRRNKEDPPI